MRDLGALTLVADGQEHPLVGSRAAAMLALLTIHVNHRVSVDTLMEAAWGERITPGAASTLTSHIWRLRQSLEPGRDRSRSASVLVNDSDGYRLIGGPSTVDSLLFAEAAADVRDVLAAGHAGLAARRAEAALALWRGTPYGAFADQEWAQPAVARLEELRNQLQERRIQGLVASGDVDGALSDLHPLIAEMPFRESLRALQMEALYRDGRGEEALEAYREAREVLVDQVGIEPGPQLQDLHRRILSNDPSLSEQLPREVVAAKSLEIHLPMALTPLVGRADQLERLTGLVRDHRLVSVVGPAGCGKTRLAIEAARALSPRFPEGVWFVDLAVVSTAAAVPAAVIHRLGLDVGLSAEPVVALAAHLQSRRILLLLDNCEQLLPDLTPVVETLLGGSGCMSSVLATSREPLLADGERIYTLAPLALPGGAEDPPWPPAPAVELFLARAGAADPQLTIEGEALRTVTRICAGLDGLPLAIELAAARVRTYSLDEIADQVTRNPVTLSRLGRAVDHHQSVGDAIDWSVRLLTPAEKRAHEALSVLPGQFTARAARAVTEESEGARRGADVEVVLPMLVNRSLLVSERSSRERGRSSFRQLTTVRTHAVQLLTGAGRTETLLDRRDAWVLDQLSSLPRLGRPEMSEAYARIEDDYPTVRAALQRGLSERPDPAYVGATASLLGYWIFREQGTEGAGWLQLALELAERSAAPVGVRVLVHVAAAHSLVSQGRSDLARSRFAAIAPRVAELTEPGSTAAGDLLPWLAVQAAVAEDFALAAVVLERATVLGSRTGDAYHRTLLAAARCMIETLTPGPGREPGGADRAHAAHDDAMAAGHLLAAWLSSNALIVTALGNRSPRDGLPWAKTTIGLWLQLGARRGFTWLEILADLLTMAGRRRAAAEVYAAAQAASSRVGSRFPRLPVSRALYAETRHALSRAAFDQAWRVGQTLTLDQVLERDYV